MLLAIEAGYRLGFRQRTQVSEPVRAHVGAIQSSMLGILALLIGFTFSLSLQRFESRSLAVVDEANAIGTASLRAELLPVSVRGQMQQLLHEYVDLRVATGTLALDQAAERAALLAQAGRMQQTLWTLAGKAVAEDPNPVTTGLFVQALNEMIDSFGRRSAELDRHVPELVLLLLYGVFVVSGGLIGYACGVAGHRPSRASHVMVMLIVLLMFVIIDLDRPHRGLIQVDQSSLAALQPAPLL